MSTIPIDFNSDSNYLDYETVKEWNHVPPTFKRSWFDRVYICKYCHTVEDTINDNCCAICGTKDRISAVGKYLPPVYESFKSYNIFKLILNLLFGCRIRRPGYWVIFKDKNVKVLLADLKRGERKDDKTDK